MIVESFRPGTVKRLGIGYETIAARNARIVYCSLSAFGQSGPYRDKPAHDLAVQALAGTADLSRSLRDGSPAMPNLVAADMAASLTALSAILMALYAREKSGKGDHIDIAMYRFADRLDAQHHRLGSCARSKHRFPPKCATMAARR